MPQSLCPLARPGERLQPLIRSFHIYHNRPINKTTKFGTEREPVCEAKDCAPSLRRSLFGAAGRSQPNPGRVHSEERISAANLTTNRRSNLRPSADVIRQRLAGKYGDECKT